MGGVDCWKTVYPELKSTFTMSRMVVKEALARGE